MRFRSKHSQLKREDHAIHNHINTTKSTYYQDRLQVTVILELGI